MSARTALGPPSLELAHTFLAPGPLYPSLTAASASSAGRGPRDAGSARAASARTAVTAAPAEGACERGGSRRRRVSGRPGVPQNARHGWRAPRPHQRARRPTSTVEVAMSDAPGRGRGCEGGPLCVEAAAHGRHALPLRAATPNRGAHTPAAARFSPAAALRWPPRAPAAWRPPRRRSTFSRSSAGSRSGGKEGRRRSGAPCVVARAESDPLPASVRPRRAPAGSAAASPPPSRSPTTRSASP